jgi:hypothetical protein
MRQSMLVLVLAGALAACDEDSGPSGPPPPGCDAIAWTATCYSDPAATEATCTGAEGTWLVTGCPSAGVVGICYGASGRITYYYSGMYSSWEAGWACSFTGGTYTPVGRRTTGWCDLRSTADDVCIDMAGTESDMATIALEMCSSGTWHADGACPTPGRSGTCSFVSGGLDMEARFYSSATVAEDMALCLGYGYTWTPN